MFPNSFIPNFIKLFAPEIGNVGSVGSMSEAEAVDRLFGDSDNEDVETGSSEEAETDEDAESEDEDADEHAEDEDAEASEDEDVLEDEESKEAGAFGPVDKKALLAKYPKLFKDFPDLGKTFAREQKFTEIFPTLEDAEQASQMAQEYAGLSQRIMRHGDSKTLLSEVKRIDPKAFQRFASGFLDSVNDLDRGTYNEIVTPIIRDVVRYVFTQGNNLGNENLVNSARYFSKVLFGNPEVEQLETRKKPQQQDKEADPEREQFERDRANFYSERFKAAAADVGQQIDSDLGSDLDSNIDPQNKMSAFFRDALKERIIKAVHNQLANEPQHARTMNGLWEKAKAAGYPSGMLAKIKQTYLARAKQILPAVRARVKQEAFKTGPVPGSKKSDNKLTAKSRNIPVGRAPSGRSPEGNTNGNKGKAPTGRDVDWRHTSDRDILDGRYTPKGK